MSGTHDRTVPTAADAERRFDDVRRADGDAVDGICTLVSPPERTKELLRWLKHEAGHGMLYDLTAIDDRARRHRGNGEEAGFTAVYQLLSLEPFSEVRVKVPLDAERPSMPTVTDVWPAANWYEREAFDMFGIDFEGHPDPRRILMPPTWTGHPLRKDHPARATESERYSLDDAERERQEEALRFDPAAWGLPDREDTELLFLNVGPQHPGTHGVLRVVLLLDGEEIVDAVPDIGFHHRGAEKMAERQTWHTYIPYTDRIDYLGGVMNNLPYLLAVEQMAGIEVPSRAQTIRVMLCEIFRLCSHLVWYGTFAQDVGALSPVFYMFTDREQALRIVEAICGDRMHPNWFRIGGVAQDLPEGWDGMVTTFVDTLEERLREYDSMVMGNRIFRARNVGVGAYTTEEAVEWGVTGPGLRATGLEWDLRKKRPYSGYEQFEFDVPTATAGDNYARAEVRIEEMRQSLRILRQCVAEMPPGPIKADHPLTTPPAKERTMHDIETLIHHFLSVSWGPVIPRSEAHAMVEASKGLNGYWLVSEGDDHAYRCRIRTPSFPHMQMLPEITRGLMVPDLLAVLGSIDFVLADVDR
jgi:NADH-quinone oxidoreductase subunit C/D